MFSNLSQIEVYWQSLYEETIKIAIGKLHQFHSFYTEDQLKELKATCDSFNARGLSVSSDTFNEWINDGSVITREGVQVAFYTQFKFSQQEIDYFVGEIKRKVG